VIPTMSRGVNKVPFDVSHIAFNVSHIAFDVSSLCWEYGGSTCCYSFLMSFGHGVDQVLRSFGSWFLAHVGCFCLHVFFLVLLLIYSMVNMHN
jgi:hypothetical protein